MILKGKWHLHAHLELQMTWKEIKDGEWRSGNYLIQRNIRGFSIWHYSVIAKRVGRAETFVEAQRLAELDSTQAS
jgi:hypothetical protein